MFGSLTDFISQRAMERSELHDEIEKLTYAQFKDQLGSWMKTARAVWLVTGNLSEDSAKSFIELQKQGFPVEPLSVSDVLEDKIVAPTGNIKV